MQKYFLSIFFLLLYHIVNAQQIYVIPRAGMSIHNLAGIEYGDLERRTNIGLMTGGALEIGLSANNLFAIQPEILFVQKGAKLVDTFGDSFAQNDEIYKINYLEIPLLLKVNIGKSNLKFFLNTGPSLGIGIGGKHTYKDADFSKGFESKIVFSEPGQPGTVKMWLQPRLDFSLQAGGGFSYDIGRFKLLAEARYGHELASIENKTLSSMRIFRYGKFSNRFLLVNVGIGIPIN